MLPTIRAGGGDAPAVGVPGHGRRQAPNGRRSRSSPGRSPRPRPSRASPWPAEAILRPSGLTATLRTSSSCWVKVRVSWPSSPRSGVASQTRMVPSWLAEARRRPSGLNATHPHLSVCPRRPSTSRPVVASQTCTVLSSPAEARRRPSGLKATPRTFPVCGRVWRSSPVVVSHSFTLRSKLAEASRPPSGLNASALTGWRCAGKVRSSCPGFRVPKVQALRRAARRQAPPVAAERHGDRMVFGVRGRCVQELGPVLLPVPDPHLPSLPAARCRPSGGLNATVYAAPNLRTASHGPREHLPGRSPSGPRPSPAGPRRRRRGAGRRGGRRRCTPHRRAPGTPG